MREYTGSTLFEIVKRKFGVGVTHRERVITVSTIPVEIAETNPRRVMLMIVNRHSAPISVSFAIRTDFASGILLAPEGGSLTLVADEDGELCGYAIYGLTNSGSGNVYVLEGVTV